MSELTPEQVRSLKQDVDELAYSETRKWAYLMAEDIKDALEEYAKLLEEIQIGVDILFDDAALYPTSDTERSTGGQDGKSTT
jgi:hypothetical protein